MGQLPANPPSPLRRLWENTIVAPLHDVDEEARAYQTSPGARGVDRKTIIILLTTAVVLTFQYYLRGDLGIQWLARSLEFVGLNGFALELQTAIYDSVHARLYQLMSFFVISFLGWLVVPMLIIRFVFGERIRDYALKLQGITNSWWLYILMLTVVMPFVVRASYQPSFLATYPYYRIAPDEAMWPDLYCWEVLYLSQFFFLEFFFRGFMLHGTRHRFGCYSIFVMTVPYCMIHFGKPMPEAFASIITGITLGFMSLKTRSILMGTALHMTVAFVMDMLALGQQGWFG